MAGDDVYLGQWTNWSRGPVLGPTLTMTQENGKYLIALIAFFIAFIATRFWRMCCFFLHRFYSTDQPSTAPYHQRQAVLRNSSSPEAGLASLLELCWAWRQLRPRHLLAWLCPALVSFIVLSGFTIAGVFSSQISSAVGNEVLLSSAKCGIMTGATNIADSFRVTAPYKAMVVDNALNYASQCYSSGDSSMTDCNRFVVPRLAVASVDHSAECPFEGNMCRTNTSNLRIDSGYIDSNLGLGLNAAVDERFTWRTVLHCAPLTTEGYRSNITDQNQTSIRYHYGRTLTTNGSLDYTYEIGDTAHQYPAKTKSGLQEAKEFRLSIFTSYIVNGTADVDRGFAADPDLQRADGDTSIIFLVGNGVLFAEQTRDEWYRASTLYGGMNSTGNAGGEAVSTYRSDEAASPLGCLNQYQYCIMRSSGERQCGPLGSRADSLADAELTFGLADEALSPTRPSSSSAKGSRFFWTTSILQYSTGIGMTDIVNHLGPRSLDSQTGLAQGIQGPLPVDQWKHDVTRWYNASKAATQAAFTNTAHGPTDPGFDNCTECVSPPVNTYEESMCQNQKILSTAYASFSLLGLCLTFLMGLAIVVLSYSLEPLFEYLHRHKKYDQYKYLEWTSHSVLQLQRQGHEALGLGTWEKCIDKVPVCQPDDTMGILDITHGIHPLLRRPSFDREAPGGQSIKPIQTEESVDLVESKNSKTGGRENGELRTDQAVSVDDTGHRGGDASSSGDITAASSVHTLSPDHITAVPRVRVDQGSMSTVNKVVERASD